MIEALTKVRTFHQKHLFPVRRTPAGMVPDGVALMRLRLMVEEGAEVAEALEGRDVARVAHELADLLYVTLGTAVTLGLPLRPRASEPCRQFYLGREREDRLSVGFSNVVGLQTRLAAVAIALARFSRFNPEETNEALSDLVDTLFAVAWNYGIPLDLCFEEVHRANMTKDVMDEGGKGGKGAGFVPADIHAVLEAYGAQARC